jgi:hypothetical protein
MKKVVKYWVADNEASLIGVSNASKMMPIQVNRLSIKKERDILLIPH